MPAKLTVEQWTHGTVNTYRYHRCRCDECRAVASAYQRAWQNSTDERRAARLEYYREYYHSHKPESMETRRAYRIRIRDANLAKIEAYDRLMAAGLCVVCAAKGTSQ